MREIDGISDPKDKTSNGSRLLSGPTPEATAAIYGEDSPAGFARRSLLARAEEIISMDGSGLITDVDGTISQIVDDPASAVVDPGIVAYLD